MDESSQVARLTTAEGNRMTDAPERIRIPVETGPATAKFVDYIRADKVVPDDVRNLVQVMVDEHMNLQRWTLDSTWDEHDCKLIQDWLDSLPNEKDDK